MAKKSDPGNVSELMTKYISHNRLRERISKHEQRPPERKEVFKLPKIAADIDTRVIKTADILDEDHKSQSVGI
jgi:chromatin segregation and condensation protein Rec8/ScpA/Scc1 (kleisin family)